MSFTFVSPYGKLLNLGMKLEKSGRNVKAADIFIEAGRLASTVEAYGKRDEQKAVLRSAVNLRRSGEADNVRESIKLLDKLSSEISPESDLANEINREKAIALIQFHDPQKALFLLDSTLEGIETSDNRVETGATISCIAMASSMLGEDEKAEFNFENADILLCDSKNVYELSNLIWWQENCKPKTCLKIFSRIAKLRLMTGYAINSLRIQ